MATETAPYLCQKSYYIITVYMFIALSKHSFVIKFNKKQTKTMNMGEVGERGGGGGGLHPCTGHGGSGVCWIYRVRVAWL